MPVHLLTLPTNHITLYTMYNTKNAFSLWYCSTARADATEWSDGWTARSEEEERTAEECRGDGPAVHEQEQASCDARAGSTRS